MGYAMFVLAAQVRIPCANFDEALVAIKGLQGRETCDRPGGRHFMWMNDSAAFLDATSLPEALAAWRWPVCDSDEQGHIRELEFRGENYGNEDLLFAAIACFVEPGSEIRMAGEDGALWRWYFTGDAVRKEFGRLVFDSEAEDAARAEGVFGEWPHAG